VSQPPSPPPPTPPEVRILNAPAAPWNDVYHGFLRTPWWGALAAIAGLWFVLNVIFALLYLAIGGIANLRPGSFLDAFDFSVQTFGTIGYGAMYPTTTASNLLVDFQAMLSLVLTALATGLVFAKFARTTARIAFTRQAVIAPMDGVPTLMVRVGNERGNRIVDTQLRIVMVRTERTQEGMLFYKMYDLKLVRERSPALTRSFVLMHRIEPGSPLYGETPESIKEKEVEVSVVVAGTDDTSLQPIYAGQTYTDDQIVWGARHADVLHEDPDGALVLDLAKFHTLEPTQRTDDFPYPRPG
jgi:inward rectifier potassium channel